MCDYVGAREIMGTKFLGFQEVEKHFGTLTDEQREVLAAFSFSEEILRACAKTHILVADSGLSLLDVRTKVHTSLFYAQNWYEGQEFARRTEPVCWRLIRMTSVEQSWTKDWRDQLALINKKTDEIPSARQIIYMAMLYFLVTGERLFEKVRVRTCDTGPFGNRVNVGIFGKEGLDLRCWGDLTYGYLLRLSSARRSNRMRALAT